MSEDFDFDALKAEMVSDRANHILDRHIDRTKQWMEMSQEPVSLLDLINKISQEPSKRKTVIAAYGAALWRLIHQKEK